MNTIVKFIGQILGDNFKTILKKIFKKQYSAYVKAQHREMSLIYKNYGLETITRFDECMKSNNFKYTLAFGSMLGAIREHGFIKHDLDIDTWMFIEDDNDNLVPELKKYGFNLLYHYSVDNDKLGKEYTFEYKGCHVDIFFIYPPINKYSYCNDFIYEKGMKKHERLPRRIEMPYKKEIKLTNFENLILPIPANAEELCEFRYGKDYMTPNSNWNWISARNNVIDWREMIPLTTHKEYL